MPKILLSVSHRKQRLRSAECLPACVAMVLDYLGQAIEYDALLSLLRTRFAVGTAAEITVSPAVARRHAAGFLAGHVTMMVLAGEPVLVWDEQPVWRVPACLHLPGLSEVSIVGFIEVDARTGEIIPLSPDQIAEMQRRADDIATRFTLPVHPGGASCVRPHSPSRRAPCSPFS